MSPSKLLAATMIAGAPEPAKPGETRRGTQSPPLARGAAPGSALRAMRRELRRLRRARDAGPPGLRPVA
jgi:hypothetical protein